MQEKRKAEAGWGRADAGGGVSSATAITSNGLIVRKTKRRTTDQHVNSFSFLLPSPGYY